MKSSHSLALRQRAFSLAIAREADQNPEVKQFRDEVLGGEFINFGSVGRWIQERQAIDEKRFKTKNAHAKQRDLNLKSQVTDWIRRSSESKYCERLEIVPSFISFPDATGTKTALLPTVKQGVLERLREISEQLSRRTGWSPAEATSFVLTGGTPTKKLIEARVSTNKITLEIDPSVDALTVAQTFRRIRARYHLGHTRPGREAGKSMRLAEFCHLRENATLSDVELFRKWNRTQEAKPKWQYEGIKEFKRDRRRARKALPTEDQISLIKLLEENPYFTKVIGEKEHTRTLASLTREGISRATLYRMIQRSELPRPQYINGSPRLPALIAIPIIREWKSRQSARLKDGKKKPLTSRRHR